MPMDDYAPNNPKVKAILLKSLVVGLDDVTITTIDDDVRVLTGDQRDHLLRGYAPNRDGSNDYLVQVSNGVFKLESKTVFERDYTLE